MLQSIRRAGIAAVVLRLRRLPSSLPKHALGHIVPPEILGGDIADDGLDGAVAGLAHHVEQRGAVGAGGGEQAAAERVAGELFPVEPGIGCSLLDQPDHGFVREFFSGDFSQLGDGAEQLAFGARGGAGGPVKVGGGAAVFHPGGEDAGRAKPGFPQIGPDRDFLPRAVLVGLGAGDGEQEAACRARVRRRRGRAQRRSQRIRPVPSHCRSCGRIWRRSAGPVPAKCELSGCFLSGGADQLDAIEHYITSAASARIAARYVDGIVGYCESFVTIPLRGTMRDDLMPGLRTTNYRRRVVIAFIVDEIAEMIGIVGVFYSGQNYEARFRTG